MKLKFNPFTGKLEWVVSKLSELSIRPHSDLTDVMPDQHHAQAHAIAGADHTGILDIGDPQLPAPPAGYAADVAAAGADGTSTRVARADHVHAHGTGYLPDAHHPQAHDHSAAADGSTLSPAVLNLPQAASPAQTVEGQVVWDSTNDKLTVGDGTARKVMAREDQAVMDGDAAGGELTGTYPNPAVATVHAGSAHHAQAHDDSDHIGPSRVQVQDEGIIVASRTTLNFVGDGVTVSDDAQNGRVNISIPGGGGGGGGGAHAIDGADHTGTLDIGDAQLPAPPTGYVADVAATKDDGISIRVARADHVHAHGTGYLPNAHHNQVHDVSDHTGTIGKVYTTLLWYLDGDVEVGDDQGATPYLEDVVDKIRIRAAVDTAPAGQDLIAEVNHSTDRATWTVVDTVTIASGSTTGETTLAAGTLQPGWYRLDINQVGSTTAGSDLTVMFVCKRPVTAS